MAVGHILVTMLFVLDKLIDLFKIRLTYVLKFTRPVYLDSNLRRKHCTMVGRCIRHKPILLCTKVKLH